MEDTLECEQVIEVDQWGHYRLYSGKSGEKARKEVVLGFAKFSIAARRTVGKSHLKWLWKGNRLLEREIGDSGHSDQPCSKT